MKLICKKADFDESSAFGKSLLDRPTPKKRQFLQLSVFSEINNCLKDWKKTVFLSRLLKRIRYWFWSKFLTTRQIFRIKISKISPLLVNFTQLLLFSIGNFAACQILKHPIYHTSGFERKFQQRNRFSRETGSKTSSFLGQFAFKKIFFNIHCQMSNLTFSHFLRKIISESDVFGEKTFFESKTLKKIRFLINFIQRLRLLNKIITSCQSVTWIST